jgi:DNA-directed RNA polymerase I subunit RPA2
VTEYFGKELIKYGFNYNGNETLYSGIYGTPFKVDIFMGVVYY